MDQRRRSPACWACTCRKTSREDPAGRRCDTTGAVDELQIGQVEGDGRVRPRERLQASSQLFNDRCDRGTAGSVRAARDRVIRTIPGCRFGAQAGAGTGSPLLTCASPVSVLSIVVSSVGRPLRLI